ncbi:MAG: GGDEF domain-containing protein [Maritimibacter sp.]
MRLKWLSSQYRVAWLYVFGTTVVSVPVAHLLVLAFIGPELWRGSWPDITAISALMAFTFSAFIVMKFVGYTKRLRELLHETRHDDLTGLLNRKGLRSYFERHIRESHGEAAPVGTLLSVDLDGFKAVNDTFGHQAGDDVLEEFAARLRKAVRPGDVIARVGGDEFIVVLKSVVLPEGADLAERLRTAVSDAPFKVGMTTTRVTASIGLINIDAEENAHDIIKRLDTALYTAKDRGGNVVFVQSFAS